MSNLLEPRDLSKDGSDGTLGGMEDRLSRVETGIARLEGAVDGLRHSQNLTLGAVAILAAFIIGFGVYFLQRADQITAQVNALPGQISADLRDITKTLSQSITAAKQNVPPTVIVVPGYSPPQPPAPTPAPRP